LRPTTRTGLAYSPLSKSLMTVTGLRRSRCRSAGSNGQHREIIELDTRFHCRYSRKGKASNYPYATPYLQRPEDSHWRSPLANEGDMLTNCRSLPRARDQAAWVARGKGPLPTVHPFVWILGLHGGLKIHLLAMERTNDAPGETRIINRWLRTLLSGRQPLRLADHPAT